MHILGYLFTAIVGISLGLVGAGGSILTVPILVYLFGMEPVMAIKYGMFLVGTSSLNAAVFKYRNGDVELSTGIVFATISMTAIWLVKKYLVTGIPVVIFEAGQVSLTYNCLSMIAFAILMIFASRPMINSAAVRNVVPAKGSTLPTLVFCALLTGIITGFLGAGGGFLIIPALNIFLGMEIRKAVGTSLFIISINTLFGFSVDFTHSEMNWNFIAGLTGIAIIGSMVGLFFAGKIHPQRLKIVFGWVVLTIALFILIAQLGNIMLPLLKITSIN